LFLHCEIRRLCFLDGIRLWRLPVTPVSSEISANFLCHLLHLFKLKPKLWVCIHALCWLAEAVCGKQPLCLWGHKAFCLCSGTCPLLQAAGAVQWKRGAWAGEQCPLAHTPALLNHTHTPLAVL
jgi:hypothetical protein